MVEVKVSLDTEPQGFSRHLGKFFPLLAWVLCAGCSLQNANAGAVLTHAKMDPTGAELVVERCDLHLHVTWYVLFTSYEIAKEDCAREKHRVNPSAPPP